MHRPFRQAKNGLPKIRRPDSTCDAAARQSEKESPTQNEEKWTQVDACKHPSVYFQVQQNTRTAAEVDDLDSNTRRP